jgi:histone H3/H4
MPHDSDDETWEKAGGGFGPVKKGGNEGDGGEPARFKPGEKAALEVEKYQKDGGYLIPKKPFRRLVEEIFFKATEESEVTRIEQSAIEALQTISETHMALVLNGKFPYDCD